MIYHLAIALLPSADIFNVFTYVTVRAGGAAFTSFFLCLAFGPWTIRMLQSLKIGQYIRKEHVKELHELHGKKSGTPTMGGVLFIGATLLSLLLWSTLNNRVLWTAVLIFAGLGIVGFMDDFIKLKRKHNDGLSARAKFAGQILVGGCAGIYLFLNPIANGGGLIREREVLDWERLMVWVATGALAPGTLAGAAYEAVPEAERLLLAADAAKFAETMKNAPSRIRDFEWTEHRREVLMESLRAVQVRPDLYLLPGATNGLPLSREAQRLIAEIGKQPEERSVIRLNRILLERALPGIVEATHEDIHTSLGVPGFKDWYLPLGVLFIPFVVFVIVAMSNAVNLTDGLDGLAAGTAMIALFACSGITYIISRADWSSYLYLPYVPEASELFVFGAALLGGCLGFLWYNAHPAEVFMGDTGSLALGGAIAAMGILAKQELLLPIIAGVFVLEAGSVVLQVASFKLTGRRIFRMSPLHHHFELLGWAETKVVARFYIIAFLFALLSLSALKLR